MVAATLIGSDRVTGDPVDMLIHYALGDMPCYTGPVGSPVAWISETHRGVHLLQKILIPRSQRRYVFAPRFDFRINTAFAAVVDGCIHRTGGGSWILPELREAFLRLHQMGLAHSYETWQDGQLVGGCFGVQMGSWLSVESMFYRVSHASKAAYGRALLHFQQRGFALVDSNPVSDNSRNYGEEWIPQWRYEEILRDAIFQKASISDDVPPPELPWTVRQLLPLARFVRRFAHKTHVRVDLSTGSSAPM